MTLQYDQPNINLQGAQAIFTLAFDSNAAEQTDTVFNDWAALIAKAGEIPGLKDIIISDDGLNTIPAGTYDMTDIRLIGESSFSRIDVTDAVFQNLDYIENVQLSVGAFVANTVPSFQYNSGAITEELTLVRSSISVGALAAAPAVDITNGTFVSLNSYESTFLSGNAGVPVIHIDATPSALIAASISGATGSNWGGATGNPAFVVVDAGGLFTLGLGTGDIFWASNQVAGPTIVSRVQDYESSVVGDWSGVEPLNVKNALDRIAAAIGPIA
jgi:hypothetical protein